MDIEIRLLNKSFPWKQIESNGVCYSFKGDILYKNKLLTIEEVINLFSSMFVNGHPNNQDIVDFLEKLNGNFSIIIDTPKNSICIVDKVRSIPLFYARYDHHIIVADDCDYIKNKTNNKFSEVNAVEFLLTGYVTGRETLIEGINQIQAGEVFTYDKSNDLVETSCYLRYLYRDYLDLSEEELLVALDAVFMNVFKRLIESTVRKGKQIVVPLSGGLDSRIIVTFLKKLGINNVICFSYGRKNSIEVKISSQVAKALGYEWHFIEYTNKKWYECYHSAEMMNFERYASNLVSLPHKQDFLAIKELKNNYDIPENSVVIPGHTACCSYSHSEPVLSDILKEHYNLWNWDNNEKLMKIFTEKIKNSIGDIDVYGNGANVIEIFDLKERQSKFIINSVRTYEFFGYEWRIPLWDSELINFFVKMPIKYKIRRLLYKKYAREELFVNDFEPLSRINCTTVFMKENPVGRKSINIFKVLYGYKHFYNYHLAFGRFFKNPLISLFLIKIRNCNIESFHDYPLLKFIIDTKNKRKCSININGFQALHYLLKNFRYLQNGHR